MEDHGHSQCRVYETKPNKNSEGRRKTATGHNYEKGSPLALSENSGSNVSGSISENQSPEIFSYLSEMLPCDSADLSGNKLTVTIDVSKIIVTAMDNGNFSIESFVDAELVQADENISCSELIKWLFTICDQIQTKVATLMPSPCSHVRSKTPSNRLRICRVVEANPIGFCRYICISFSSVSIPACCQSILDEFLISSANN